MHYLIYARASTNRPRMKNKHPKLKTENSTLHTMLPYVFATALLLSLCNCFQISAQWENSKVVRAIDLGKSYVKEAYLFKLKNVHTEPVDTYYFPMESRLLDKVGLVLGSTGQNYQFVVKCEVVEEDGGHVVDENQYVYFGCKLPIPVSPNSETELQLQIVYLDELKPIPDQLPLNGKQSLLFSTNKLVYSPYETLEYELEIVGTRGVFKDLESGEAVKELPNFTKLASKGNNVVAFEHNSALEPFSQENFDLYYEHNLPLIQVENLKRDVWVSHWGNSLNFEEQYEVHNGVGKLKNGFSRLEWMKIQQTIQYQGTPTILALDMVLPEDFTDAYFVDLVGNVSTSQVMGNHLVLKPRYPIFGGWNYNFTIGWTHSLDEFVKKASASEYIVKVPLLNGAPDMTYKSANLSFYLPEGASVIDIESPIVYQNIETTTEKSYLDFKGHTKVTITYKNLVDEFGRSEVLVKYRYSQKDLLQKPATIGLLLLVALVSYLLLSKIDVAIQKM